MIWATCLIYDIITVKSLFSILLIVDNSFWTLLTKLLYCSLYNCMEEILYSSSLQKSIASLPCSFLATLIFICCISDLASHSQVHWALLWVYTCHGSWFSGFTCFSMILSQTQALTHHLYVTQGLICMSMINVFLCEFPYGKRYIQHLLPMQQVSDLLLLHTDN